MSKTKSSGTLSAQPFEHGHEDVGALDQLRLGAGAEPDAVLEERADDERGLRNGERRARGRAVVAVAKRKACEIDPDRDAKDLRGVHTGSDDELVHLRVRHLHPVDATGVALERLVGAIELRVAGRAGTPVEVAEPEPVRRVEPARLQRTEVVVMENGLVSAPDVPRRLGRPRNRAALPCR